MASYQITSITIVYQRTGTQKNDHLRQQPHKNSNIQTVHLPCFFFFVNKNMNAVPIDPPFVLQHVFMSLTYDQVREQTRFVRMPIPIYYAKKFVAKIIGVGESGKEYVYDYDTRNVYLGMDNYVTHLDNLRTYPTRRSRETCIQSIAFCIHTKNITMGQWKDSLCGWGETTRGTVACLNNTLEFPEEPGFVEEPPPPTRILHLPEPPMRFGTIEDDSDSDMDDESVDSMGFPLHMPELLVNTAPPSETTECSICCGEFTDGIKHAPCGHSSHSICSGCLARHATNWTNHCVSATTPYVSCPHEGCTGMYSLATISNHISQNDFQTLQGKIQHFLQRQYAKVACPQCSSILSAPAESITDVTPGGLSITCQQCQHTFCWHCMRQLGPTGACMFCINSSGSDTFPGEFNRYVPKKDCVSLIPRNYELTIEDCMRQLHFLATDPTLVNKCRACNVGIHRASACAEISHCGLKQCTVCGMSGLEFENHLIDHWSEHGLGGTCPRWLSDPFWGQVVHSQCRCTEGICHDDTHDCSVEEHRPYREEVIEARRLRHIKMLLRSLPKELRRLTINQIVILNPDDPIRQCLHRIKLAQDFGGLV